MAKGTNRIEHASMGQTGGTYIGQTGTPVLPLKGVWGVIHCITNTKLTALKAGELRRKIKPIRENVADLNNDLNRGLINEKQYEKKLKYQEDLLLKIVDKYNEAFSVYKIKNYKQPIRIDEFIPKNIKQQSEKLFGKN